MKLERLHIQGFKSFKDRTTIHFDEGITGIVGPNGCGKSNIVDALFWVMGEQSAKHLRGTKMSDLIFSGSNKYSPGSFAEVTLVLQNDTGKHIHIGNKVVSPQEIQLTRKLYKNGETEYRINDGIARLKDIQEVFMDTGAGAKSYSIIAQGEIDRLVKAKPHERRVIIEEVAGITKFKLRKKESLRKIDQTNNNLERIYDLKKEVHKGLKKLESQAEKAQKARGLKEKIKRHALIVNSHRELDLIEKIFDFETTIKKCEERIEELNITRENLKVGFETKEIEREELINLVDNMQEEFNDLSKKLVSIEERLKSNQEKIVEKENYIKQRKEEALSLDEELSSRDQKIEELELALSNISSSDTEENEDSQDDLELRAEELKVEIEEFEELQKEQSSKRDELHQEIVELDALVYKNTRQMEDQARSLQEINQEIEDLETYFNKLSDESDTKKEQLLQLEQRVPALELQRSELNNSLETKKSEATTLSTSIISLEKNLIEAETKLNSLEELSFEGVSKEDSKEYLKNNDGFLFQDIFSFSKDYEKAAEALLLPFFDCVVGESSSLSTLSQWVKDNKDKSLGFLKASLNSKHGQISQLKSLSDCADFKEGFNTPEWKSFLSLFYIADELAADDISLYEHSDFLSICSSDGTSIIRNFNGHKSFEKVINNETGTFARKSMIESLKKDIVEINNELSKKIELKHKISKEISEISERISAGELSFREQRDELISLRSSANSEKSSLTINNDRLKNLQKRKQEISNLRLDLCESEESLAEQRDVLQESFSEIKDQLANSQEEYLLKKEEYDSMREALIEAKSEQKSLEFKKTQFTSQIEDLKVQKQKLIDRCNSSQAFIDENQKAMEQLSVEEKDYRTQLEELSVLSKDKEIELSEQKDSLSVLLNEMQDYDKEIKELNDEFAKLDKESGEKAIKLEKYVEDEELLTRNSFEEHRVCLRDVILKHLELNDESKILKDLENMFYQETENGISKIASENYDFQKKFPGQLKESMDKLKSYKSDLNRLGQINWEAVEEYDRQKLRYDFLKEQEDELKASINDLLSAIDRIDTKSKARFQEAYAEVNGKFQKVFPIIFGGGSASLQTSGHIDDENFGIEITASPPGKKMQNINLMSGGEKALTAVALIFSIFLVKPSPFCLLDEVDAPLDDANVGRFNQLLREMSSESQFILITHNKKTMELNDRLYGITMQEPGVSKAVSVQLH